MAGPFERHDLTSCRGRVLVAGDVHGRFDDLSRALDEIRYDDTTDRLVLLGDLVNKGPDSHLATGWLGHMRVLGNHEVALRDMGPRALGNATGRVSWLKRIGGLQERMEFARRLGDAPVMLEVRLPSGRDVGFVHAGVPRLDWAAARALLADPSHPMHGETRRQATGDREHAHGILMGRVGDIPGVDHVFLGHTPMPSPITIGNTTLCDTSRSRRPISLIDIEPWIEICRTRT